jgi:hypothetical protein
MQKGQTSIEFIIIVGIVIVLAFFFISSLFSTFDSNVAIYKIKNKTLELISISETPMVISEITTSFNNRDAYFTIQIDRYENSLETLDIADFSDVLSELERKTDYDNINLDIIYT